MKKLTTVLLILFSLMILGGCGDSKESVEAYRDRASYLTLQSGDALIRISELYLERGTMNLNGSQFNDFTKEVNRLFDYMTEFTELDVPEEYQDTHDMMLLNFSYAADSVENFLNAYNGGSEFLYDTALEYAGTYFDRVSWFFEELGYK